MKKRGPTQHNAIGPLSVKSMQLPHYVPPPQEWAPNARVCNSAASGTCGRVDSLLAAGHLEECGDRRDPHTGKRQKLLQLPRPAQRELAEGAA